MMLRVLILLHRSVGIAPHGPAREGSPARLVGGPAWDLVVLAFCGLGLALSSTAVVVAWRRLQTIGRG